jgi:hypothetical protein
MGMTMIDNDILRARRKLITPAELKETPAEIFARTVVEIAGAIAFLGGACLIIWAALQ